MLIKRLFQFHTRIHWVGMAVMAPALTLAIIFNKEILSLHSVLSAISLAVPGVLLLFAIFEPICNQFGKIFPQKNGNCEA